MQGQVHSDSLLISHLTVKHLHDSGWNSHQLELELTSELLLIHGSQQYRGSGGLDEYCTFPVEIPLDHIVSVETKPKRRFFSSIYATRLYLEFKDERGRMHDYNFIPNDAVQSNAEWSGGNSATLLAFSVAIKNAMETLSRQAKHIPDAPHPSTSLGAEPVDAGAAGGAGISQEQGSSQQAAAQCVPYRVLMSRKGTLQIVNVYPALPVDPTKFLVEDIERKTLVTNVGIDNISDVVVRQRVVRIADLTSHQTAISLGPSGGPKVYELCLKTHLADGKEATNCFISDMARCNVGAPCLEAEDGGRKILALERDIHKVIAERSEELRRASEEEAKVRAKPSGLVATVDFDDSQSFLPNHQLDAGEQAELNVIVKNQGPGPAYGVRLSLATDQAKVQIQSLELVGDIPSGETRSLRLPVVAGLDIGNGEVRVSIEAQETRGFDARKTIFVIPTTSLAHPALSVEKYEIRENPHGGETFWLTAYIRNNGTGPSVGTMLTATHFPPNVVSIRTSANLGVIQPGQVSPAQLVFGIPRTWTGLSLDIQLNVTDGRGESIASASRELSFPATARNPVLMASMRLLAGDPTIAELTNGQSAEVEIVPQNDGDLEATNVVLRVSAPGAVFKRSEAEIGVIRPKENQIPLRFPFFLPRGYTGDKLPVSIQLTQSDFPAKTLVQDIPVKRRIPVLQTDLEALNSSGRRILEKSHPGKLALSVRNDGDLPAEKAVAKLVITVPGFRASSPTEIQLGTIPAHGISNRVEFTFDVLPSAGLGNLPVQVSVTQADFGPLNHTFQFQMHGEEEQVVHVKPTTSTFLIGRHTLPIIAPAASREVNTSTVQLSGTIADEQGISKVSILVNGIALSEEIIQKGISRQKTEQGMELIKLGIDVPLIPGKNTILITAYNLEYEHDQASLDVNRLEERSEYSTETKLVAVADVDKFILSSTPTPPNRKLWAVIIGIERYRHGVPNATFANRDAIAVREYFLKLLGVPSDHIQLLLDGDATKTDMEDLLEGSLPPRVRQGDRVFFYFSGHGIHGIGTEGPYLLPFDGNLQSIARTGYPLTKLYKDIDALSAERKFVFLDACFSGLDAHSGTIGSLVPDTKGAYWQMEAPVPPSVISFAASGPNQVSNTYRPNDHGLFTYFLLDGLRNNLTDLSILSKQVIQDVEHTSRELFGETQAQRPVLTLVGDEHVLLAPR